ncbi:MAG TPA: hypothetical protein PKC14_05045, partial [Candidatus Absconditabacterales bacterium]|nr:hypothetical protein [Candidatus Absconditabacterales bacterium]
MKKIIVAVAALVVVALGIYYRFEQGRRYDFMGHISYDQVFQTREYTGSLKAILPDTVLPVQLGKRYIAGGTIFQFVMQPTHTFPIAGFNPMLQKIHFAGILVYDPNENKLQRLFSIKPRYVGGTG